MVETEKQKDKELYSYKRALSQPYWIQKLNDDFSLKNPIKFSRVVYFVILFGLFWVILEMSIGSSPFGFRGMVAVALASQLSAFLSDVIVDGKGLIFYLVDYFLFYIRYGIHSDRKYINRGQFYIKPKFLIRKGEK